MGTPKPGSRRAVTSQSQQGASGEAATHRRSSGRFSPARRVREAKPQHTTSPRVFFGKRNVRLSGFATRQNQPRGPGVSHRSLEAETIALTIHRMNQRNFALGLDFAPEKADLGRKDVAVGLMFLAPEVIENLAMG